MSLRARSNLLILKGLLRSLGLDTPLKERFDKLNDHIRGYSTGAHSQ